MNNRPQDQENDNGEEARNKLDTMSEVLEELKERGYRYDFNLTAHAIEFFEDGKPMTLSPDEFEIIEVRRFEGPSSPSDNAILYVIESNSGLKGTLVDAYGVYADTLSHEMIKKLDTRYITARYKPD
ncbi:hypothetical protein [Telluribacter sp.]|jgi:hypothetical protein|uniref:hypothetical protein n=1 Tax=Telluribacter sp. TaxID=1978767 RepID=UPI002E13D5C2|nr:hypothetical protein [Telluribacter sp.]